MAPLYSLLSSSLSPSRPSSSFCSLPLSSASIISTTHNPIHAQLFTTLSFPRTPPPPPQCLFRTPNAASPPSVVETADVDFGDEAEGAEDVTAFDSPWEGAVVYRRDASVTHVEYSTTLERLGLGMISTDLSRTRAAEMGIRLMPRRGATDPSLAGGTPVLVSIDITRKKKKLKLDGIVRTVIVLFCNRCGQPATECVFSNFALLLTEEPMEEPEEIDMGVLYGDDKFKASGHDDDDDERGIDLDDRLHFPAEETELDISKHIRDLVHVEITINAVCDPTCKGLCLKCGTNLNKRRCGCNERNHQGAAECGGGPLKDLKNKMQQR